MPYLLAILTVFDYFCMYNRKKSSDVT